MYIVNRNDLNGVQIRKQDGGGILVKARCPSCRNIVVLRLSPTDVSFRASVIVGCSSGLDNGSAFQLVASYRPQEAGFRDGVSVWGNVYPSDED